MSQAILLASDSRSNANMYYRTHFLAGDPFIYAENGNDKVLVVSPMEAGRAAKESSVQTVKTFNDYGYRDLVKDLGDRKVAYARMLVRVLEDVGAMYVRVEGSFPVMYADLLRADGVTLEVDPSLLVAERRCKNGDEIAAIEEAQRATERAMAHAIDMIAACDDLNGILHFNGIPLTSERLRLEIETLLMREEMDTGDTPIVAGGAGAADPHWLGSGPLRAGEAIVLDLFPRSKRTRYHADMTRTVVKGEPSDTLRAMYKVTSRALDAALVAIRPGANGKDVHEAADAVYREAGYEGEGTGPRFIHSTGHGLGLDIHEEPSLGTVDVELLPGDVVTVEPGLYDPDVGGVRIEDVVVVTDEGHRNLTRFPRRFEV